MSQKKQKQLTSKALKFCDEYIIDYNGTRAAKAAGYSDRTASVQAHNLLQDERIQARISQNLKEQQQRTQTDADKIVEEFAKVGFSNIKNYFNDQGELIAIQELDPVYSAAIKKIKETEYKSANSDDSRIVREYELHDKLKALENLGNHFRIYDKDKPMALDEIKVNVKIKRKKNKAFDK
jgi:phage terminase small subunit